MKNNCLKIVATLLTLSLTAALLGNCGSSYDYDSNSWDDRAYETTAATQTTTREDGPVTTPVTEVTFPAQSHMPPAIPDPARVLKDAEVTVQKGVETGEGDSVQVYDCYTYNFSAPAALNDNTNLFTYQFLLDDVDYQTELLGSDGFEKEYAILWQEAYLAGYLVTDGGTWTLFVAEGIDLDSTPNAGSGNTQGGMFGGSFQNDSFGIEVIPGVDYSGAANGSGTYRCEACGGSGICSGCGGDGWADDIYHGEHNAFRCTVCVQDGVCNVCDGEGVWVIE